MLSIKIAFLLSMAASSVVAMPSLVKRAPLNSFSKRAEIEFGYEGNSGPNFWPDKCQDLNPGQSPIDIREGSADAQTGSLVASLTTQANATLFNSGHDLRVEFDPNAAKATFVPQGQTETFEIEGFHFHSPSEHHVNGKFFDAEMHMVAKSADKNTTSVLSVLFELSETPQTDSILSKMAANLPLNGAKVSVEADFASVLEATNQLTGFHTYTGSLTTPPCSKRVLWNVMDTPVPISIKDALAIRTEIGYSARFTQVARDEEPVFSPPKKAEVAVPFSTKLVPSWSW